MAGAGGLAVILLAGLVAFCLSVGAIAGAGYALFGPRSRRAYKIAIACIVTSTVAILLSMPFWVVAVSRRDSHGDPIRVSDSAPIYVLVIGEALVFLAAVGGTIRQRVAR